MLFKFFKQKTNYALSNHFDGKKFFNPHAKEKSPIYRFFKWVIIRKKARWPAWITNTYLFQLPTKLTSNEIAVTFINHASFLIQSKGLNIIIDPIYSKRASPNSYFGPKRVRPPGIPFSELPKLDIVLISHNHYDHLDIDTLKKIREKHNPLFISGLGNKEFLNSHGFKKVIELDWWEKYNYEDVEITFLPAQHFSARSLFDRNLTLWGGFLIKLKNKKIYHMGDSGYGPHFQEIHKKIGSLDLSLIPIGSYKPRWFMKKVHMNPEEAVLAHIELDSKLTIPMHYGTFSLSDEAFNQPLEDLDAALEKHRISNFKILECGETFILN